MGSRKEFIGGAAVVDPATELMSRIRTRLMLDQPFFGTLAMRLHMVPDASIETLSTDGTVLRFNPAFLASLPERQQVTVVAHEVMHCALLHPYRRGGRDPKGWNEAADYALNTELVKAGFDSVPGWLLDSAYAGMGAEAIYALRASNKPPEGTGGGPPKGSGGQKPDPSKGKGKPDPNGMPEKGDGGSAKGDEKQDDSSPPEGQGANKESVMGDCPTGEFEDAPAEVEQGEGNSEQDWQIAAEQAAMASRMAGSMPGNIEELVKRGRESETDWVTATKEFITNTVASDYTWNKPNRRFIGRGLYLPGVLKENVGKIVIGVDASGSTLGMRKIFASEIVGIIQEAKPEEVHVVYWDTQVTGHDVFLPDDAEVTIGGEGSVMKMRGGGGTRSQCLFDYIKAKEIDPIGVIVLTDLYIDNPAEPEYPVLWAVPEWIDRQGPFGITVKVRAEHG